ncbi:MAG TPA: hypothetical protein PKD99_02365 [Sphingopyxis sp.]|nr:hypothetical protein [Sphingopyxis sp.]HMP43921.1 hypothetical protein [Sphingopyxis sp.]HMQ18088.1 hypothetical protein [Sphingopyxis sp.]
MTARRKRERRDREALAETRRHKINQDYAARHPDRAREERGLRQAQAKLGPDWRHKREGTPETHARAARTVQGALARLFQSGAIDANELGWAAEIASVHAAIVRDVVPATVSLETRVDRSGRAGGAFFEALGRVRAEIAYSAWRAALPRPGVVLAMITEDLGVSAAARRFGMRNARAKLLLIGALNRWPEEYDAARRAVDAADLAAAQAGLM